MTDREDPPQTRKGKETAAPGARGAPGWQRMLLILALAQLLSSVGFSMVFPFLPNYVTDLGTNTNISIVFWTGAVFSSQAITMALASPLWGALADRLGRKPMLVRALLGGSLILGLMGFAGSAEQLVLLRAIQGVLSGTVSAGNAMVAAIAPRSRSGYAMSVLQTASWSGIAVGPVLGGFLADRFGYSLAFVITAALLLVGGLLVLFGTREDFQAPTGKARRSLIGGGRDLLKTVGIKATFVVRFTSALGRGLLVPILPLFIPIVLHGQGATGTFTGFVIGASSATGTVAAILLGNLGDRIGHRRILTVSGVLAAVTFLPMAFATEGWHLLVLNALSGIALGGLMPAVSALIAQYAREDQMGSAFGLDNSVMSAARAVSPLVAVGAAELFGYQSVFVIGAGIFLLCTVLSIVSLPRPALQWRILSC